MLMSNGLKPNLLSLTQLQADEKTCPMCSGKQPVTHFSTLARWMYSNEPTSEICTYCYWVQLVTHSPKYTLSGVYYVPCEDRQDDLLAYRVNNYLPRWLKDEKVIEKYKAVGSINEQLYPFYQFLRDWWRGFIPQAEFLYGLFPMRVKRYKPFMKLDYQPKGRRAIGGKRPLFVPHIKREMVWSTPASNPAA